LVEVRAKVGAKARGALCFASLNYNAASVLFTVASQGLETAYGRFRKYLRVSVYGLWLWLWLWVMVMVMGYGYG
jgi:hypothetical protein